MRLQDKLVQLKTENKAILAANLTPLVMHGSSGIPDAMLQEAISNGI